MGHVRFTVAFFTSLAAIMKWCRVYGSEEQFTVNKIVYS